MKVGVIYGLCEPTGDLRYIGKTLSPISRRLKNHIAAARRGQRASHLHKWLRKLSTAGETPRAIVLEANIPQERAYEREQEWIAACRLWGVRLVNATDGGPGALGYRHTAESIAKIRAANTGVVMSPERRRSRETRAKLSATKRGIPKSPEHRAKIAAAVRNQRRGANGHYI